MALFIVMSKSAAAAKKYFAEHLRQSDYYSLDGASPGVWFASLFFHETTRPLKEDGKPDPHMHIHAYCFNRTWAEHEGRWQAAQLGDLHLDGRYLEAAFEARLGRRLRALGYALEANDK